MEKLRINMEPDASISALYHFSELSLSFLREISMLRIDSASNS